MRLVTVVPSMCLIGVLAGTAFAQAPQPPAPTPNPAPAPTPAPVAPVPQPQVPRPLTDQDKAFITKTFNDAVVKEREGEAHPFRIECSATSMTCPSSVFISAATISDVVITGIPQNKGQLTVRVTAGETDENQESLIVRRVYAATSIPDHIVITIYKARKFGQIFGPKGTRPAASQTNNAGTPAYNFVQNQSSKVVNKTSEEATSDDPSIGFVSLGRSEALAIQLQFANEQPQTIMATLSYQRWFVDMGGFITFGSVSDQELVTEDAATGTVRILKKRRKDKLVPGTGIVLNFHPANYPALATQFGIATSVDRAASYYLGVGYRLRELGPKTLATIALGIAATQVKRFPDVHPGDIRSSTAPAVTQGSNKYAFGPYLSLSLGFSFGGTDTPVSPPNPGT